ncbi:MAG TPA: acyltransferase family protein [Bauldia sp.]|nr:acyltransferase family protein [Bauldia sp.]
MQDESRVAWVDYAKGFCIVMVVMMHSTLGVEKAADATGWMTYVVAFAKPFRMPDFFMISGLFLARVIDRDWRTYLDKKVVHFAYFYVLWLTIQFVFKAPAIASEEGIAGALREYALSFIEPFGTIWFIYLLPIFFVVVKATRSAPWWIIWVAGALLEAAHVRTGWIIIDEFAARFVYFYSGYVFAPHIFRLAAAVIEKSRAAAGYLVAWGLVEGVAVFGGVSEMPGVSLALGLAGAVAVVSFAGLLSKADWAAPLRYCGRNSIVIYLAFFLPMATSRAALLKLWPDGDLGTISLIVTACGVVFPLVLFWIVRGTPFRFLFERPAWARLGIGERRPAMVAAE